MNVKHIIYNVGCILDSNWCVINIKMYMYVQDIPLASVHVRCMGVRYFVSVFS